MYADELVMHSAGVVLQTNCTSLFGLRLSPGKSDNRPYSY